MNPTKRKEISKITAEQLDIELAVVDDIVSFFYRTLQKKMSGLTYPMINVPNFGTFFIKRSALERKLEKYQLFAEKLDESESIRAYEIKQDVKKEIEKFKEALATMDAEAERKKTVYKLKQQFIEDAE